jgi:DNA polymerase
VGGDLETIGIAEARSALSWWLASGVDVAVQEEPRNWLKPAPRTADPAAAPNVAEPTAETLAALQQWLASSAQLPLASATARRILPHRPEDAPVKLHSD